jgi:hypothetical protein
MATKQAEVQKSARSPERISATRQCPYCGVPLSRSLRQCPHCREALETAPEVKPVQSASVAKRGQIRRGLLYMLLAAVIHYFAGGYSAMELPLSILQPVTAYLSLLLFLGGLGLTLYGFYVWKH